MNTLRRLVATWWPLVVLVVALGIVGDMDYQYQLEREQSRNVRIK